MSGVGIRRCCCIDAPNTPWSGGGADKLYLTSGKFTSTLKTSEDVSGLMGVNGGAPGAISWNGTDTPWLISNVGSSVADEFVLQSGQFTSTVKSSVSIPPTDQLATGISWDGTNTPNCTRKGTAESERWLMLFSGQFTTTVKTSQEFSGIGAPSGISYSAGNTPVSHATGVLSLFSGQFTTTVKDSADLSAVYTILSDVSWDGADTVTCSTSDDALAVVSGQFTTTIKETLDISSVDSNVQGVNTNSLTIG